MTIQSEVRKTPPYSGDDTTTAFPFAFKVFSASDVSVILTDPSGLETVLTTGYSVSLNSDQDDDPGGTVTKATALATGYKLTITSNLANLQPVELTNLGGFYPTVVNDALDRITILVQQVAEKVDRAIKVSISSDLDPDQLVAELTGAVGESEVAATAAQDAATLAQDAAAAAVAAAESVDAANLLTKSGNLSGIADPATARSNIGIVIGTSAGQIPLAEDIPGLAGGGVPAGAVAHFARSSAPTGWLKANGATVSRTTYASLFAAIGTTFGIGDGSTTFTLPDLRGEFIRSWDDARGVDSGRIFGSAQTDELKSHTHTGALGTGGSWNLGASASYIQPTQTGATGGTETRPRNVALLACIKY